MPYLSVASAEEDAVRLLPDLAELRTLSVPQLDSLAPGIRSFLIEHVCATGGHLGPNPGGVELTLALHRVFDSPRDSLIFDTGHQAYVHKLLTGRAGRFTPLLTGRPLPGQRVART